MYYKPEKKLFNAYVGGYNAFSKIRSMTKIS